MHKTTLNNSKSVKKSLMKTLERNKRRLTPKESRRQEAMRKLTCRQKQLLQTNQVPDLDEFISLMKYA